MSPFDALKAINSKSPVTDEVKASYNSWIVLHALSNTMDTTLYAAAVYEYHIPESMQFDFLYHAIPKGKRYGKWNKLADDDKLINNLCELYSCNRNVAKQYLSFLSDEEKQQIIDLKGSLNGKQ